MPDRQSGRSSGVEHNLAKVGVEGSNPFARSNDFNALGDSAFAAEGGLSASMRGSMNSCRLCKSESLAFVANFADPTLVPIRPTLLNRSGCDQE
jgi:hypothetical protein